MFSINPNSCWNFAINRLQSLLLYHRLDRFVKFMVGYYASRRLKPTVDFKFDKKHDLKVQIANDWGRSESSSKPHIKSPDIIMKLQCKITPSGMHNLKHLFTFGSTMTIIGKSSIACNLYFYTYHCLDRFVKFMVGYYASQRLKPTINFVGRAHASRIMPQRW